MEKESSSKLITMKRQLSDPIKEVGLNGCQFTSLVDIAIAILSGLDTRFPCRENDMALTKYREGQMWQEERTKDREKRGVEGYNKA